MVTVVERPVEIDAIAAARNALDSVVDPELPVLTIADLGILRDVRLGDDGTVEVIMTPTYLGCPAIGIIAIEIEVALERAQIKKYRVIVQNSPAWTTDWLSEGAREKLRACGIAPPAKTSSSKRALFAVDAALCPICRSDRTERVSEFGSTACKALYRCLSCREPFDCFKCI